MPLITRFDSDFADLLPETLKLLLEGGFCVHPGVSQVTLHGSRGLAKGFREDSDIDLCLSVDMSQLPAGEGREDWLREVVQTTLSGWKGSVELDLAVAFDTSGCGLVCLEKVFFEEGMCAGNGTDCFGLFKTQCGFDGHVTANVEIKKMYPCLVIWKRR